MGEKSKIIMTFVFIFIIFLMKDETLYCQESLKVDVEAGVDGITRVGDTPIKVNITNNSGYKDLKVQFVQEDEESDFVEYSEDIDLGLDESKEYYFYIPLKSTVNEISFKIYGNEELLYESTINFSKILKSYNPVIGVCGNIDSDFFENIDLPFITTNTSDYSDLDSDDTFETEIVNLSKNDKLFNNKKAFNLFDVIILDKLNYEFFTKKNFFAVKDWVDDGGIILIASGENPVVDLENIESEFKLVDYKSNLVVSNSEGNSDSKIFIGSILHGKSTDSIGGNPITVCKIKGNGSIVNFAFDINTFKSNDKEKKLEIIKNAILYNNYKFNTDNIESKTGISHILSEISDNLPFSYNYKYAYMLGVFSLYVLIILILVLTVFRKRDKRNFIWYFIPIATIVFSIPIYLIGNKNFNISPVISSVSVAKYNSEGSSLDLNSYFTTVNNNEESINLSVNKDSDVEFVKKKEENSSNKESIYQSSKLEVTQEETEKWEKEHVIGVKKVDIGNLQCKSSLENNNLKILLNNNTNTNLEKSFIIYNDKYIEIGDLNIGESKSLDIDTNADYPDLEKYLKDVFSYPESLNEYESSELYTVFSENPSLYTKEDIENKRIKDVIEVTLNDKSVINENNLESNEFIFISMSANNYWEDIEVNSQKPNSYNINLIYSIYKHSYETARNLNISSCKLEYSDTDNLSQNNSIKVIDGMVEIDNSCIVEMDFGIPNDIENINSFYIEEREDSTKNTNYEIYNVINKKWEPVKSSFVYKNIKNYLNKSIKIRVDKSDEEIDSLQYIKIPKIIVQGEYGND